MTPVTLHISGMSCGHCLNAVRNALTHTNGVEVRSVQMGRAELSYDEHVTSLDRIRGAIADAGY
ncbi:MAG TPA: cation transporter, partial [Gemmatimonadales bacterium]|nr:cation transporter [Gemmatimonadales bacterium]